MKNQYIKDFKTKKFVFTLAITLFIILTRNYITIGINNYIIAPFRIDQIKSDINLDILAILIMLGCFLWLLYISLKKRLFPTLNSICNILFLLICYIVVIRTSNDFELESIFLFLKLNIWMQSFFLLQ